MEFNSSLKTNYKLDRDATQHHSNILKIKEKSKTSAFIWAHT